MRTAKTHAQTFFLQPRLRLWIQHIDEKQDVDTALSSDKNKAHGITQEHTKPKTHAAASMWAWSQNIALKSSSKEGIDRINKLIKTQQAIIPITVEAIIFSITFIPCHNIRI